MLGSTPRAQRSLSSVQLPVDLECTSSAPVFYYSTSDFIYDLNDDNKKSEQHQKFKDLFMFRWECAKKENVFNYELNSMYKLIPGDFNLSIQLNIERGQLRRKPMRFHSVNEPFNALRWNFNKLKQNEVMLYMRCKDKPISVDRLDRHVIAINNSPLERGHSLIIPAISQSLPQVCNEMAIRIATDAMLLYDDESFHILFNSLLANASVNHLHLHALTWPYSSDIINRRCEHMKGDLYVIRRPSWFISSIIFQLPSEDHFDKFIWNITKTVQYLNSKEVAFNIFFTRAHTLRTDGELCVEQTQPCASLVTAYIFPRVSIAGAKPSVSFNAAALELAGCLTAHSYRFFDTISEEVVLRIIDEQATLSDVFFNEICAKLSDLLLGIKSDHSSEKLEEHSHRVLKHSELTSPELDELRDSFQTFELHSPRRVLINNASSLDDDGASEFTFNFDHKNEKEKCNGSSSA
ncbi:unnamed protein product [Anisakis simplex]|uniref:GDP-D-glucose phosphorylase 1 n=1 Tax=Anisakis simplex TaxID=6269 RepID=A0A0M3JS87_ANISI|nr:unnamed protein product [Anisakis simplex]